MLFDTGKPWHAHKAIDHNINKMHHLVSIVLANASVGKHGCIGICVQTACERVPRCISPGNARGHLKPSHPRLIHSPEVATKDLSFYVLNLKRLNVAYLVNMFHIALLCRRPCLLSYRIALCVCVIPHSWLFSLSDALFYSSSWIPRQNLLRFSDTSYIF